VFCAGGIPLRPGDALVCNCAIAQFQGEAGRFTLGLAAWDMYDAACDIAAGRQPTSTKE
jgi:hypothetical protein